MFLYIILFYPSVFIASYARDCRGRYRVNKEIPSKGVGRRDSSNEFRVKNRCCVERNNKYVLCWKTITTIINNEEKRVIAKTRDVVKKE